MKALPRGGLLALDWGQKKVGYATADEMGLVVTPRGHFRRGSLAPSDGDSWDLRPDDVARLRKLHAEFEPGAWMLGLPLRADGAETEGSRGARRLAQSLSELTEQEVILVNEALTSWNARGAKDEDAEAAAQLLRDYLRDYWQQRERES